MDTQQDVELTPEQRDELDHLLRAGNAPARTQTRARILLLSDRSQGRWRSAPAVAEAVMVHPNTVRHVRRRFVAEGLPATLYDKPRPGAVPKLDGELEARLLALTCSEPPAGHTHWTLRLLANQLVALGYVDSVSHVTVGEWLKKRTSALAGQDLVHRQAFGNLRGQDGGCAGRVPASPGSAATLDLSG